MHPPKIFISATSGDLGSVRQIIKEALLTINCHPVEQANFEPDARTVESMLRGKISDCQALIHICGMRYGAEPDVATLPPGSPRRSYTQMEYHIARQLQEQRGDDHFRVYTFICPEDFPYDAEPDVEPAEKRDLQRAHRSRLFDDPHLRDNPNSPDDLRHRILTLQEQVLALKQEQTAVKTEVLKNRRLGLRIAAGVILLLLAVGWGIHWIIRQNSSTSKNLEEVRQDVIEVKSIFSKERKFMSLIFARANERIKDWENMKPGERFDLALDQIAAEQNIPAKELRDLLDLYEQRVEIDPDAEAEDKFYVLIRKQSFGEAAQLAQSEGQGAEARMKQQATRREAAQTIAQKASEEEKVERQRAIDFYQKEGSAQLADVKYEKALTAYQKAASLVDKATDPLGWANAQLWVASLLHDLARYKDSEPLKREVLRLREQHLPPTHPDIATALSNLATLLQATNRLEEAEPLMRRALKIDESNFGADHPDVATNLNNLALLLQATNRLEEAEPLMRKALKIDEANFGPDHPVVARDLSSLAHLLKATNRLEEGEPLMRRALKMVESSYGPDHPNVAIRLNNLAQLLKDTNRLEEAEPLMRRALKINEASFGSDHPKVAIDLSNLATLLQATNRLDEAEPLMRRALKIGEASLGPDHPDVAIRLNILARLLYATNRLEEAEPLMRRSLKINEASFDPDHPDVATAINNLAQLLKATNRLEEAEPLMRQAISIYLLFQKRTGHPHPHIKPAFANYLLLTRTMKIPDAEAFTRLDAEREKAGLDATVFNALWTQTLDAY